MGNDGWLRYVLLLRACVCLCVYTAGRTALDDYEGIGMGRRKREGEEYYMCHESSLLLLLVS